MSLTKLAQMRYANDNQLIMKLQFMYVLYRFCSLDHSVSCIGLISKLINERVLVNPSHVWRKNKTRRD